MGFSVMLRGAEILVPAEYWCPYGIAAGLYCLTTSLGFLPALLRQVKWVLFYVHTA